MQIRYHIVGYKRHINNNMIVSGQSAITHSYRDPSYGFHLWGCLGKTGTDYNFTMNLGKKKRLADYQTW